MKQINLAEWAIKHKQIVYFFIFFILLGGIMSYFSLGRSEDPAFTIREAVVTAAWPGASAEQITEQVTDPLEKTLQDVKGLDSRMTARRSSMSTSRTMCPRKTYRHAGMR